MNVSLAKITLYYIYTLINLIIFIVYLLVINIELLNFIYCNPLI